MTRPRVPGSRAAHPSPSGPALFLLRVPPTVTPGRGPSAPRCPGIHRASPPASPMVPGARPAGPTETAAPPACPPPDFTSAPRSGSLHYRAAPVPFASCPHSPPAGITQGVAEATPTAVTKAGPTASEGLAARRALGEFLSCLLDQLFLGISKSIHSSCPWTAHWPPPEQGFLSIPGAGHTPVPALSPAPSAQQTAKNTL